MSTIKSSDEHLTLNADGSSKDIKFQANGVEKASISSAGAFTSTTIDATKLTGNLPAISGAALTGVGVAGITSSADATAMTISSSEKVRVGATNQTDKALLSTWQDNTDAGTSIGGTNLAMAMQHYGGANSVVQMGLGYCVNHPPAVIGYQVETNSGNTKGDIFFATRDTTNDVAPTERLRIKVDGRGLSQFTAKVWGILDGNTNNIKDSHNVSSITDHGAGDYTFNFTNNLASSTFCTTSSFSRTHWDNFVSIYGGHQTAGSVRVTHNRTSTTGGIDTDQLCIQVFGD